MPLLRGCWVVLVALAASAGLPGAEPAPEAVDQFGNLAKLNVIGGKTFCPQQIRDALSCDYPTLVAAHRLAPLEELPNVVQSRLLAGLLQAGHVDASVQVRIDREQHCLEASVDEGSVYVCGDVRIESAVPLSIPVPALIERLTRPYPPEKAVKPVFAGPLASETTQAPDTPVADPVPFSGSVQWLDRDGDVVELEKPVWPRGEPAPMSDAALKSLRKHVEEALADVGFRASRFELLRVVDREARTVLLRICIKDEGPATIVGEIEISGAEHNSRPSVLDCLGLKPGVLLTRYEQSRLEFELWRSGRFIEHKIEPVLPAPGQAAGKLRIELTESPSAPRLDDPLSREQRALLRTREWLANESQWQDDFCLSVANDSMRFDLILAPARGVLVSLGPAAPEAQAEIELLATSETVGVYFPQRGRWFEVDRPDGKLIAAASSGLIRKAEEPDKNFSFNLGLNYTSKDQADELPFQLSLNVSPAMAVGFPTILRATSVWDEDVLTLTFEGGSVAVDSNTGRLIQLRARKDQERADVGFRPDALNEAVARLRQQQATSPNLYQADRPLSSLAMLLADEELIRSWLEKAAQAQPAWQLDQIDLAPLRLLRRLVELDALAPLDAWILKPAPKDERKFDIPADDGPDSWIAKLAAVSLPWADEFFPRETWPWIVWRETALTVAGHGKFTSEELRREFYSNESGPVCHLAISSLLKTVRPPLSGLFAARGLTLTDVAHFRNDYGSLLDTNTLAGQSLMRAGEILRQLEAEEVAELSKPFPELVRNSIETLAAQLRERRDQPIHAALPNALDASWNGGWADVVAEQLRALADPP